MSTMQEPAFSILVLIARILLSAVFLVSGIHKALWYSKAIEEFKTAAVPLIQFMLPATIILHIGASICILVGVFVIEAASGLIVFTMAATFWVFPFWRSSGSARLEQSRIALANLGVTGGLLILVATGPGQYVLF
jgi:putative oxidoreductase